MKAFTKVLMGGAAVAALAGASPAAAQYYPGYPGGGYGYGGGLGGVIDQILGGNRYAYGVDQRRLVEQCIAAVTDRVAAQYGRYNQPYGYGSPYGGYGNGYGNAYGSANARVLGITDIDRRSNSVRVRGVATANANAAAYGGAPYGGNPYGGYGGNTYGGYGGYGYAQQPVGELTFSCSVDYRGRIRDIDVNRNNNAYYGYYRR
jgi:hypothetical protein